MRELYGQATGKAERDEELVGRLYGKGYDALEADWLAYLKSLSPTPEEAQTWSLTVRSFDLMRRYETAMDPDARILPDQSPTDWTSGTLKIFLRQKQAPANIVLETALIAAQERLKGGDPDGAGFTPRRCGGLTGCRRRAGPAVAGSPPGDPGSDRGSGSGATPCGQRRRTWTTWETTYTPPATLTETLQLPFTAYRQEVVRLDVAGTATAPGA